MYANIRELLPIVGQRVLDVTQHDEVDFMCDGRAYFCVHLDGGVTLWVFVRDDETAMVTRP